ncbi:trypsin-like peptidase domain-containing protein, partial [Streptomyces sp. NPDC097981]|uniref:nSTAND1 domain-containing NTPase n=1 Tax=Streptomyces sp. NPDC097981 TaxID=3155428 RepID=UPI0033315F7F
MTGTEKESADGTAPDLLAAMVQVLRPDGAVVGAGFLVSDRVVATCAHVVEAAGGGPGAAVQVAFPHVRGVGQVEGQVPGELWRATQDEDVAFIRLSSMPAGARVLPLGSAEGCRGHQVRSFGFPAQAPPEGHFGFGVAGDLLPGSGNRSAHLQLTAANDLTTGFSGGPVLDEVTGLVIGMLTEIAAPDEFGKGQGVAYVTPTQVLRGILPELVEREVCPYRGLEPFTAEHARWFQGRQEAVRQVVTNLAQQRRLTLLLGPSGSGKSSLIQAGVLRELTEGELPGSDRWLVLIARPRQDLAAEIERAGLPGAITTGIAGAVTRRLAAEPDHQRILLIIDQFEELFIQTADGHRRNQQSVADQIAAAVDSHAALSVILVMRDDFYPQLAALAPGLLKAAASGLLNVPGTLNQRDLNDIITLPARDVGLHFQPGLPERIVSDVLATNPEEAPTQQAPVTVLPLLELTLSQLWVRRQNGHLTHEAYRRIGAVSGSLTTWCDSALNALPPDQQLIARRMLTSLVRPADRRRRVPAVRAQVPLNELRDLAAGPDGAPDGDGDGDGDGDVDTVLAALARHRIITTQTLRDPQHPDAPPGEPVAELIHDALIRDWGTLSEWVREDHRFHDWLDRTRERHASYAEKGDPGDLLGGTALAEGLEWARQRRLPGEISAFIMASKQRQQAAIRRTRRLNTTLATLVVVMLLALLAVGGAVWQWQTATVQRQAAQSRQFAIQSDTLIDANPALASLLAIEAYRTSSTAESIASLQTAAGPAQRRPLTGHSDAVNSVTFSPNGQTCATASSDRTVRLWDVATGKTRVVLPKQPGAVLSVAFSPDGQTLATAGKDGTVGLWDVDPVKSRVVLPKQAAAVWSVAFSPDGQTLATASEDGTVGLWDVDPVKSRVVLPKQAAAVWSVAFSP